MSPEQTIAVTWPFVLLVLGSLILTAGFAYKLGHRDGEWAQYRRHKPYCKELPEQGGGHD